jgi:Rod binding domain-containing protein
MAKPGLASSELTNSDLANRDKPSPLSPEEAKAALAAQTAQGRYYGRKTPKAETLLRNKSSSLTEEEKIGQLKKIKKAAEDYEGLLMKEMIKSVRQSPLVKTAGSDTYSEIAEKPFTAALTAAGGLGLSERVVTDVARQQGLLSALEEHPEIMGPNYRPKISPNRLRKAPTLPKGAGATNSETTSQMTNSSSSTSSVNVPAMAG